MGQLTIQRCSFCSDFIPSGRSDRVYCSNACKQKAYRWRNKMQRYASKVKQNLSDLSAYIDYPDAQAIAIKELRDIEAFIKDLYQQHRIRKVA